MRAVVTRQRAALLAGGLLLALLVAAGVLADWLYPDDPMAMVAPPLLWPGQDGQFPLGTDSLGRDVAAGLVHGARASLLIGFAAGASALLVGVAVGAAAGFLGGYADDALMRISELFQSVPPFMLLVVLLAIVRPSLPAIILAIAAVSWPPVARLVRGEFTRLRGKEFVQSCQVIGMSDLRIITTQILPNTLPVVMVSATMLVATAILMEAALSFLGLGDPNLLTWGSMIGAGRDQLREAWFIIVLPGAALLVTAMALALFGEGLNAALSPQARR